MTGRNQGVSMGFRQEFVEFLDEYGVIGLAVAFVMGLAVKDLVSATVDSIMMPVVEVFLPSGNWQTAVMKVAGVELGIGQFLSALIDFVVIAFLVFAFVKYGLGREKVKKL
ncbi:MAG: MscL family protein [Candidatus Nanohaloarchaea archaeon]